MLVSIDKITPLTPQSSLVEWTSSAAALCSWAFCNGALAAGPIQTDETARSAVVKLESGKSAFVEIHDVADGVTPTATVVPPNVRPSLLWAAVEAAAKYRAYHAEEAGAEGLVYNADADDDDGRVTVPCPVALNGQGGVWHWFRVESVAPNNAETTRAAWSYYVMEPPAPLVVAASNGSAPGLFDLALGA